MRKIHIIYGGIISSVIVIGIIVGFCVANREAADTYLDIRNRYLMKETQLMIGSKIELNPKEKLANKKLMDIKLEEYDAGFKDINNFIPYGHFFNKIVQIEKSKLFNIIKKLPKGASLHTHLVAAASFEYVFNNLTYEENLHACILNNRLKLQFFPHNKQNDLCQWELMENLRKKNDSYNDWLKEQLTLVVENPREIYNNIDVVWTKFSGIFSTLYDLISYRPVFERYIYQVLFELFKDNVFYVEFRAVPMPIYELNGIVYDTDGFFKLLINAINSFKRDYPHFLDVKFIYSPYRKVNVTKMEEYMQEYLKLKHKYPEFVVGFDLVGFEDKGTSLKEFLPVILNNTVKYFFHAGETNWYGTEVDLNLLDAILINSTRIAHAYALIKHPILSELLFDRHIAIEICPISNQVLMLLDDFRNHPASMLVAKGYPVVVCNDDPGYFGTRGLSYDWYIFYMTMTSRDADLRLLKELAMNSIKYSTMSKTEKETAYHMWNLSWKIFIDDLVFN